MSQEAARPSVKSTYKNLSEVLTVYWGREDHRPIGGLIDILHNSFRLTQWEKITDVGYRIWSVDEAMSVTVSPERIYTSKGNREDHLQEGLPAQSLYNAIQTARQIVQTNGSMESDDEYFEEKEDGFSDGAALDVALADTHAEPLIEDDAELIEDVCQETISPTPDTSIQMDTEPYDPERIYSQEVAVDESFTAKANRKNAAIDGYICHRCGNLNQAAYKGSCPKCPRLPSDEGAKQAALIAKDLGKGKAQPGRDETSEAWLMGRLKSMQGRILTILDASPIADKAQRDAVKTLVNKEFRREMNRVSDGGWRAGNPRYEGE